MILLKKKPTYKTSNVGLYLDIYCLISLELSMMIKIIRLYIFILFWKILTLIQGHSCMRNQRLLCPFSQKFCSRFG